MTSSTEPRASTRKEGKEEQEEEVSESKKLPSLKHERQHCGDLERELQIVLEDRSKLEDEVSILKKKLEQKEEMEKDFAKTREKLAGVQAEKDLMETLYNCVVGKITTGNVGFQLVCKPDEAPK